MYLFIFSLWLIKIIEIAKKRSNHHFHAIFIYLFKNNAQKRN